MKILLLGASGQVGWELARTLPLLGELVTTTRNGPSDIRLDVADLKALEATLDATAPDVIVNATAYTAVDKAEDEPNLAMHLNAAVPELIGRWSADHGARVVHYSTDYVFDGSKPGPYVETDTPNPVSIYGRTKLSGDEALLASGCDPLILRVSWVYGRRGRNFLLTMQRLMTERGALRIVRDQVGAPTWCRRIAEITTEVLQSGERGTLATGVYHLAPSGETSWFGFASAIRDHGGVGRLRADADPVDRVPNTGRAAGKLSTGHDQAAAHVRDRTQRLERRPDGLPGTRKLLRVYETNPGQS